MISVRRLGPEDWPLWRELRLRALEESPEAFASTLADTLARDTGGGETYWRGYFDRPGPALVAEVDGRAADMARVVTPPAGGAPADLFSVWVSPEVRGRGVGRALITACTDWLAEHHPHTGLRLAVVEANGPARRLYTRCGFTLVGRNPEDDAELLMEHRPR